MTLFSLLPNQETTTTLSSPPYHTTWTMSVDRRLENSDRWHTPHFILVQSYNILIIMRILIDHYHHHRATGQLNVAGMHQEAAAQHKKDVFSIIFTQSTIGAGIQFVWPIKLIRGCNIILYSLGWWWYPELCLYQRSNISAKQDNPLQSSTIFQGPLNGFWSLENKLTRLG